MRKLDFFHIRKERRRAEAYKVSFIGLDSSRRPSAINIKQETDRVQTHFTLTIIWVGERLNHVLSRSD